MSDSLQKTWDFENEWHWTSPQDRMHKFLAQYELYKTVKHLPGAIVELGVFKANSLIRFATYRSFLENDNSRKILGFDAFGTFPVSNISKKEDVEFIEQFEASAGHGLSLHQVSAILEKKNITNTELYEGNVLLTLTQFLKENTATRICLLHLDLDVKEPTAFALDLLYDRVVPAGLILFDDYGSVSGETEAVDEFISRKNLKLQKYMGSASPSFIRKPD